MAKDIFEYVTTEENAYKTRPVAVTDGYEWHMYENIRQWVMYKDGKLQNGNTLQDSDGRVIDEVPVKNIILPILNVHYRTEGFDLKDIEVYVDNDEQYHKSLLLRKFHEKWGRMEGIDTFIDELVESYVDFGGALVKKVKGARPEVIKLQQLAFADQTDILSGPFAIKHQYSIDQLQEKAGIWDEEAINDVITMARMEKEYNQAQNRESKTPGKYIEVYEVHGVFPESWLTASDKDDQAYESYDGNKYVRQVQIISYYNTPDGEKHGITLFSGKTKDLFKFIKRDQRFGTALGRSAIEELVEPQVWTNYGLLQARRILDKAALLLGISDDPTFSTRNKLTELDQGEWLTKAPNTTVEPFIFPTQNLQQFEQWVNQMEEHARLLGSANEATLGISPASGTPFKLQDLVVGEGKGIHEYRRGQIAVFVEEIYRDWIIPQLVDDMNRGQRFLTELSTDELIEVADRVADNFVNDKIKKIVLTGKVVTKLEADQLREQLRQVFIKEGGKRFVEIIKDEIKDIPVDVKINIAGKQKNLTALVDKLTNVIREVMRNPQMLQDPNVSKLVNLTLETSGISPMSFRPSPLSQPANVEAINKETSNNDQ